MTREGTAGHHASKLLSDALERMRKLNEVEKGKPSFAPTWQRKEMRYVAEGRLKKFFDYVETMIRSTPMGRQPDTRGDIKRKPGEMA